MLNLSREVLRDYIKEQKFTSPNEVLSAMELSLLHRET